MRRIKNKFKIYLLNIITITWWICLILIGGNNAESTTVFILTELALTILLIACSVVLVSVYGDHNE